MGDLAFDAAVEGGDGRVWSPDGRLLGTGIQQMLLRATPPPHVRRSD